MAGRKGNAVVAVLTMLTDAQAANIQKDIIRAKQRHAPGGRGTAMLCEEDKISKHLQEQWEKAIEKK